MSENKGAPALEVRIDALVLDGFGPGNGGRIAAAFEEALARLFAQRGVPAAVARGGTLPRLEAGSFTVRPGDRPAAIGARVAMVVYEGLSR